MSRIRIEWVPIANYNLGFFGFDHLQLVFQPSPSSGSFDQINWKVMAGAVQNQTSSPHPVLRVAGADGNTTLGQINSVLNSNGDPVLPTPEELEAQIGTPQKRGSQALPYLDPFSSWSTMTTFASEIDQQGLPYVALGIPGSALPTMNSTSVIASLLYYSGLDLNAHLPLGMRLSPGGATLLGTTNDDTLQIENGFKNIAGGKGSDILSGTNGLTQTEAFYGGKDDDAFLWSKGFNIYHGGQPSLNYSEDGIDTIIYDNVGDIFINQGKYPIDHIWPKYVATHEDGYDWWLSIERINWDDATDTINVGEGVRIIRDGLRFDLGGEQGTGDKGDTLDLSQGDLGLLFNSGAADSIYIQTHAEPDITKGL